VSDPEVHEGKIVIGDVATLGGPDDARVPTVKYVHYAGSQQLILWLPRPGYQGYGELAVTRGGVDLERGPVAGRLNGSVQILFNTLAWAPGDEGWRHEVRLEKFAPGVEPPAAPQPEPVDLYPPERNAAGDIIYRDGSGNVLPDIDLEMRDAAMRDIARKFARRLEYEGNFRAGTIHYIDGERRISFWHEMGGGGVHMYIDIPTEEQWESRTDAPLALREEIVAFVAERVQQEKASSWQYRITGNSIDFY
jgi:hypothetical protein